MRVRAELRLHLGAVEVDHHPVDLGLLPRVHPGELGGDRCRSRSGRRRGPPCRRSASCRRRAARAPRASRSTRRTGRGARRRTPLETALDLERRVSAGIEDLPGVERFDGVHRVTPISPRRLASCGTAVRFYGRDKGAGVMRKLQGRRAAAGALALLAGACARVPPASPVPLVRYGPDRDRIAYRERAPEEKKKLLARINEERAARGLQPLTYDLLAAKVGDAFCQDAAANSYSGHWDLEGRPPYLRWALAGGIDYHAENVWSLLADRQPDHALRDRAPPPRGSRPDDGRAASGRRAPASDPRPELDARRHRRRLGGRRVSDDRGVRPARGRVGGDPGGARPPGRDGPLRREAAGGLDGRRDRGRLRCPDADAALAGGDPAARLVRLPEGGRRSSGRFSPAAYRYPDGSRGQFDAAGGRIDGEPPARRRAPGTTGSSSTPEKGPPRGARCRLSSPRSSSRSSG